MYGSRHCLYFKICKNRNYVSKKVRTVRTDWPISKTLPLSQNRFARYAHAFITLTSYQNRCARYAQMGKIEKKELCLKIGAHDTHRCPNFLYSNFISKQVRTIRTDG